MMPSLMIAKSDDQNIYEVLHLKLKVGQEKSFGYLTLFDGMPFIYLSSINAFFV
jgi:hypothetical protein